MQIPVPIPLMTVRMARVGDTNLTSSNRLFIRSNTASAESELICPASNAFILDSASTAQRASIR